MALFGRGFDVARLMYILLKASGPTFATHNI